MEVTVVAGKPHVSVVMSVYNCSAFVGQAIDSVLGQVYTDLEFIVVDDGSTDGSCRIIGEKADSDDRIVLIKKRNTGLTDSLNVGLAHVRGAYIARIDCDDLWLPDKLKKQIDFLQRESRCYLLGTGYEEIDGLGRVIRAQTIPLHMEDWEIRKNIVKYNPFFHSSVVFRREAYERVGGYDPSYKYAQDYEYWVRIMGRFRVANLPEVLAYRRYTEGMISEKKERLQRYFALKANIKALRLFDFKFSCCRYLLGDLLVIIMPRFVTKRIRVVMRKHLGVL